MRIFVCPAANDDMQLCTKDEEVSSDRCETASTRTGSELHVLTRAQWKDCGLRVCITMGYDVLSQFFPRMFKEASIFHAIPQENKATINFSLATSNREK